MNARTVPLRTAELPNRTRVGVAVGLAALACATVVGLLASAAPAHAAAAPVGLGTAAAYSVLGGSTVTNTGPSILHQNLGVSPGSATTGFPPGLVLGATHKADAPALKAKSDLVTAYNDAAGRAVTANLSADIVGQTLVAGVYKRSGALQNSGALTLNAKGNPSSVWIFQISSTLKTASFSTINMINGAQACNVYWQVGSSATLGTTSHFIGTIMALTSVSVTTGTTVEGRALARNGAVTLDDNVFTVPGCATSVPTSGSSGTATGTATATATAPVTGSGTATATGTGTGTAPGSGPGGPTSTATVRATSSSAASPTTTSAGVAVPRVVAPRTPRSTTQIALTYQRIHLATTGLPLLLMRLLGLGVLLAVGGTVLVLGGGRVRAKYTARH
jgi:hypothetical protein